MEKIIRNLSVLIAFVTAIAVNAQNIQDTVIYVNSVMVPDTIVRTDTIVIREVITRTDVVHRTETVVRYEEKKNKVTEFEEPLSEKSSELTLGQPPLSLFSRDSEVSDHPEGEGNYMWIPDSLILKVDDLLSGKASTPDKGKIADFNDINEEKFNPDEKVTFRGDTLPMVLKSRNLGRYDRGLFNFLFIPKGIWQIGLTASYGEFSTSDLEILDLVSDIDFYGHIFSIKPYFSYFIKNNVSLGLRLGYTSGKAHIGSFNVDIDEDMSFNLHDIMYQSNTYSGSVTLNQFFGITRKGRFGIFNEVELALAGGSSDFHRPYNTELRRTHTNIFEAALNFSPGVCVYILDQLSFNVSFGVFGLNIKHEKQKVDDMPMGERTTSGANFRFNIFNINFGIAVNI